MYLKPDLQDIIKRSNKLASELVEWYQLDMIPCQCFDPGRYLPAVLDELRRSRGIHLHLHN